MNPDEIFNLVKFTQYMRPDGRRIERHLNVDALTKKFADKLEEQGCEFAAELLTTGHVAVYVEYNGDDLVTKICNNGPEMHETVKDMIESAAKQLKITVPEEK